jgi:hypothetical protein
VESCKSLHLGRLQPFPANITFTVKNALVYYIVELTIPTKSDMLLGLGLHRFLLTEGETE